MQGTMQRRIMDPLTWPDLTWLHRRKSLIETAVIGKYSSEEKVHALIDLWMDGLSDGDVLLYIRLYYIIRVSWSSIDAGYW